HRRSLRAHRVRRSRKRRPPRRTRMETSADGSNLRGGSMRIGQACLSIALASSVLLAGPRARAQPGNAAAAGGPFDEAKRLMASGNYAEACPKFLESSRLDPGVGVLLYLGDCYEKAGQTASAWAAFREATSAAHAAGQPAREQTARDRAAALEGKL